MDERRTSRRIRRRVERPGLDVQVAADLNLVVSTGSAAGSSARQDVHVVQRRSSAAADRPDSEEQS